MKKIYRKVLTAGMALALALGTIGCGQAAPAQGKEEEAPIAGGWQAAEDGTITEELQALFDKAMEKMVGVDYTPVELLETQVVAGTNYKFLCESQVVAPGAKVQKAIVIIYEDLEGNAEVLDIEVMEESGEEALDGGWQAAEDGTITEELQEIFDRAMEKMVGVDYTPVELLETQIVSGTNYKFLCESQVVAPDAPVQMAVVTIYEDLEGNAEVLDIEMMEGSGEGALLGGWQAAEDGTITEELQEIFDKAAEGLVGVSYTPIELLETQIVSGTNYRFLCESRVVAPNAEAKQVIVTVYRDLNGNASITDVADAE